MKKAKKVITQANIDVFRRLGGTFDISLSYLFVERLILTIQRIFDEELKNTESKYLKQLKTLI